MQPWSLKRLEKDFKEIEKNIISDHECSVQIVNKY